MDTYSLTKCQSIHGAKFAHLRNCAAKPEYQFFIRIESDPYLSNYQKYLFRIDLHP